MLLRRFLLGSVLALASCSNTPSQPLPTYHDAGPDRPDLGWLATVRFPCGPLTCTHPHQVCAILRGVDLDGGMYQCLPFPEECLGLVECPCAQSVLGTRCPRGELGASCEGGPMGGVIVGCANP
jgi:hypothetical protein